MYDVVFTQVNTSWSAEPMFTAIYLRVSSHKQDTKSQEADLFAYKAAVEGRGEETRVFREKATGTNFDRPQWQKLWNAIQAGKVSRVVVWRLDRLGRLAGATIALLDELEAKGVAFLSIRDGFDPSTPAGRLTRNVLASVAQFETEIRRERQMAGIEKSREENDGRCPWGGREAGIPNKTTRAKIDVVRQLHRQRRPMAEIARVVGLTRQTVYRLLSDRPAKVN
jgi:DNA invertase Pin-like site-specific DNA recombinase